MDLSTVYYPIITSILLSLIIVYSQKTKNKIIIPYIIGLCVSLIGDIFMCSLFSNFTIGIICFCIVYVYYTEMFIKTVQVKNNLFLVCATAILCFVSAIIFLFSFNEAKNILLLFLYFLFFTRMVIDAIKTKNVFFILGGMLLYIGSLLLMLDMFVIPLSDDSLMNPIIYILSQVLIFIGMVKTKWVK